MKENVRKRHFCHFRTSPWCVQFYESDVLSAYFSTIVRRKEMQRLNLAVSSIESCLHTPAGAKGFFFDSRRKTL